MPNILITGSNQGESCFCIRCSGANVPRLIGLGFQTIRHLAKSANNTLFLCARNASSGEEAVKKVKAETAEAKVRFVLLDVTDDASIAAASLLLFVVLVLKCYLQLFGSRDRSGNTPGWQTSGLPN